MMVLLRTLIPYLIFIVASIERTHCTCCCLETESGNGPPDFTNYGAQPRIYRYHQAIIPSYNFNCCGNITEWAVDVHPGGRGANDRYNLDLQVWRPSPTVNDSLGTGQYSLVGNNSFTSISLRNLVARVTPSPQDYIQFQPGDVLGFYVEEARESDDGVVVLTNPSSFTSEIVWYASIDQAMAPLLNRYCPISVGVNGVLNTLTQAAPVISLATCKLIKLHHVAIIV